MKYRKLGTSDIEVSEISLGCWMMGGLNWVDGWPNGWANVNEDEITAAVKKAVDVGVNHLIMPMCTATAERSGCWRASSRSLG